MGVSCFLLFTCVKDPHNSNETAESSSKPFKEKGTQLKEPNKIEETLDKAPNNIVTSLAEKAMSVAGPVVPTKEDGEVDQERSDHLIHGKSYLVCI